MAIHLLRRAFLILSVLLLVGYAVAVAAMFFMQRSMVYDTIDTGGLTSPETLAVQGSTRVTIETPDGERIAGWYLPPQAGKPVFLFMHGKKGELERRTERWQKVRDHGAGILVFSYRGFPGSTGHPTEAGLNLDARAAYDWLRKLHPAENIVLHGFSLGTGVAVTLATEVPARALILEAPFTALSDVAARRYPWIPIRLLMIDQFRSLDRINRVKMPILIAHGDQDPTVPYAQGEELFAQANEPKTFISMTGSDHNSLVRDGLYEQIWPFLDALPVPQTH